MTTTEERMRILKMLEEKQISAAEAAKLLEALRTPGSAAAAREESFKPRWLRIRVTDRATGRNKVNVNLPAGLVDVGMKMGARFAPEMAGMDWQTIQAAIKDGMQGKIVEVDDEDDNERVEIFVE